MGTVSEALKCKRKKSSKFSVSWANSKDKDKGGKSKGVSVWIEREGWLITVLVVILNSVEKE